MRKRFITPKPQESAADLPDDELLAQSETTHRYSSRAIEDIRLAIAQAKAAADSGLTGAEPAAVATRPVSEVMRSWSADLPPMAATEDQTLTETTQRYADRSVAGIREAIAAARAADPNAADHRAAARFALSDAPNVKVPSMVLEPRPEGAQEPRKLADDSTEEAP